MAAPPKLKRPKRDPLAQRKTKLPRNTWVFKWVWTLDPKATAKDINGYKKSIMAYYEKKINTFNTRKGTKYKPVPVWSKKVVGGVLKLTVKINLKPTPPPPMGGAGLLNPPPPRQPPPPPL